MQLSTLRKEQIHGAANASWGPDLTGDRAIAEALRAELWARRTVTRRPLCVRVAELMGPLRDVDIETVRRVLGDLERDGDVTVGDRGLLAAAPLRAVDLGNGSYLLAGGPETLRLRELLGCEVFGRAGLRKAMSSDKALVSAVERVGGVVLTPERWAGLDRVPPADAAWLESLDAEYEHDARAVDSIPAECGDWRGYLPDAGSTAQRQRWKKSTDDVAARLWRSRHDAGYWVHVWTAGHQPSHGAHLRLAGDVACRAMFALDRTAGHPIQMRISSTGGAVVLDAGAMLPRAEYRYLITFGERLEGAALQYRFPEASWPQVSSMLVSRLGVDIGAEDAT
jgi:hypothetical protein